MAPLSDLVERIRGEIAASQEKIKQFQGQQVESHHARQQRLEKLESLFDRLKEVWKPRLEALAKEFGDRMQVKPSVSPRQREATFDVKSPVATVRLRFSAGTDPDVRKLCLAYDLDILPILMQYDRHVEVAFPLDDADPEAIGAWFDDRIVDFVKTYLSIHENQYYLRDLMVEDTVMNVRFPKFAAAATRQRNGQTHYFISEESAAEFDRQK
ncbi:MAG: hypothetical protein AB7U73_11475 [Pirellulales bacterium]